MLESRGKMSGCRRVVGGPSSATRRWLAWTTATRSRPKTAGLTLCGTFSQKGQRGMYFQQFLNQLHGCASYLIASRSTGEAAIVDPALETEQYDAVLRLREVRLRYVIDTHI